VSRTALVLAAHGSRVEPRTNAQLAAAADRIAVTGVFDEVTPAFHHGAPSFSTVLDGLSADAIVVVPVMTSEGYYCDVVLPRELRRNRRFEAATVVLTRPVGTHPAMAGLARRRFDTLVREFRLDPSTTCAAVVGHGTARHARSREATVQLAQVLQRSSDFAEFRFAFLDEPPRVETLLEAAAESLVVVPFLISGGPHATADIPRQLGMSLEAAASPPFVGRIDGRTMICDRAVGEDPCLMELILDLACASTDSPRRPFEPLRA
jgi:sirohydrochlorin cobaltochelatase